jgi:hypothetical protein
MDLNANQGLLASTAGVLSVQGVIAKRAYLLGAETRLRTLLVRPAHGTRSASAVMGQAFCFPLTYS